MVGICYPPIRQAVQTFVPGNSTVGGHVEPLYLRAQEVKQVQDFRPQIHVLCWPPNRLPFAPPPFLGSC